MLANAKAWVGLKRPVSGGSSIPRMWATAFTWESVTSTESRADEHPVYVPADVNGMAHRSFLSPDQTSVLAAEMDISSWLPCRVVPFDGSSPGRRVGPQPSLCTDAAWSPDGKWMYFSADTGSGYHIWRQRFPDGVPEQVTTTATEEQGISFRLPDGVRHLRGRELSTRSDPRRERRTRDHVPGVRVSAVVFHRWKTPVLLAAFPIEPSLRERRVVGHRARLGET